MKKKLVVVLAVIMVVVATCLVACNPEIPTTVLEDTSIPPFYGDRIVVVEKTPNASTPYHYFEVSLSAAGLTEDSTVLDVLQYLSTANNLTLDVSNGFINKFDQLPSSDAGNEYIMLYTSVEKDFDTSAYATRYALHVLGKDDVIVQTSAVGASQMSIEKLCVIYIETMVYNG